MLCCLQELDTLRAELGEARNAHALLQAEYSRETERSRMEIESLREKVAMLEKLKAESDERIKELGTVNDLLHEQLQELGQKVTILNNAQVIFVSSTKLNFSFRVCFTHVIMFRRYKCRTLEWI